MNFFPIFREFYENGNDQGTEVLASISEIMGNTHITK